MRILLVTSVYPTPYGPHKGTFNAALVTGLHLAGDDVRVVAPIPWTDRLRRRAVGTTAEGVSHPLWWYPPKVGHHRHHRWMRRTVLPAARTITEEWRPDLVLGYWTHPDGTVALEVAREFGVPGVLLVGGSDILVLTAKPARRAIIVETLLAADRVLAVGAPLRDSVVALGVPAERVDAFARGVDRQRFAPTDGLAARRRLGLPLDRPIALWVGRMVPVKGLDVLMAAWSLIHRGKSAPLLVLAGDGEQRGELAQMAARMGDSVQLVGSVSHAALRDWYAAADVVVLPSRSEGVPNVLIEGLACGTPFVASAVGAVPDLLEPNSRVVPPGNVTALAGALDDALQGPPLSRRADSSHIPDRQEAVAAVRAILQRTLAARATGVVS
ncbi:MAG: glycosyltransferase [Gemmatimonadales bacterium]|nr:glycosyltransferase [Gemmatimonadales bacterium]MBP6570078.1 glycosyltransferase [Gemmatimonadales bacterium]